MFNYYANNIDKTWYESSNIKYSECIDNENSLKTLKVVFTNGTEYEYSDVDVNDYLLFRDDMSQGSAFNKYIKSNGYEYKKIGNADVSALDDELAFRSKGGYYIKYSSNELMVLDSKDVVKYSSSGNFTYDLTIKPMKEVLEALGNNVIVIDLSSDD